MDSNFQYAGAVNLFVAPTTMSPSNKGRSVGSVANRRTYLTGRTDPARADNQHFVGHSFSTHPQSWSGLNGIV